MADALSLNTSLVNGSNFGMGNGFTAPVPAFGNNNSASIWTSNSTSTSNLAPLQNNNFYNDDFMMSGFDFKSLVYDEKTQSIKRDTSKQTQPQAQVQAQPQVQQQAQIQPQTQVQNMSIATPQQPVTQTQPAVTTQANAPAGQTTQAGEVDFSELNNCLVKDKEQPVSNSKIGKIGGAVLGFLAPIGEKLISGLKNKAVLKSINWKHLAVTCPIVALAGFGIGSMLDGFLNSKKSANNNPSPQQNQQPVTQQA